MFVCTYIEEYYPIAVVAIEKENEDQDTQEWDLGALFPIVPYTHPLSSST